jgi:hypothetical protein
MDPHGILEQPSCSIGDMSLCSLIGLEPFTFEFFNEFPETIQMRQSSSVALEERFLTIPP